MWISYSRRRLKLGMKFDNGLTTILLLFWSIYQGKVYIPVRLRVPMFERNFLLKNLLIVPLMQLERPSLSSLAAAAPLFSSQCRLDSAKCGTCCCCSSSLSLSFFVPLLPQFFACLDASTSPAKRKEEEGREEGMDLKVSLLDRRPLPSFLLLTANAVCCSVRPNYIRCACFAPLSRRRKSGANHIPCAVPASLLRFPVISFLKNKNKTVGAEQANIQRRCTAAPLRRRRRRRAAPCAIPTLPPHPPPSSPATKFSSLLSRDVLFSLFSLFIQCIPKKDGGDGPADHLAETVPLGVDNDGPAELTQMVLFFIGALLVRLHHHHLRRRCLGLPPSPSPSSFVGLSSSAPSSTTYFCSL